MRKHFTRLAWLLAVLGPWASRFALAQTVYVPAAVTGYTADVIANGTGPVASSTTNTVDRGNATVKWCFANHTFTNPAGISLLNQPALPDNGLITSVTTPGLTFQMAPANANNSLRIDGAASGTLTLTTPQPCSEVMVMATEGNGNTVGKTFTVTFTDGTTQVFNNIVVPDWFNGTITPAILVGSRVSYVDNSVDIQTTNPRLYEVRLSLAVANYSKLVQSVGVAKTSTDPVLNVMGISLGSNCLGVPLAGTAVSNVPLVCPGNPAVLSLTGNTVSGGITYQWQISTNGGATFTDIAAGATTNPYTIRPTVTAQYRARVTCALQSSTSTAVTVTVAPNVAAVAYSATPGTPTAFCQTGTAPVVTATPAGGRFTATTGLVIDATTGLLDLAASTPGTYTVTYTVTTPCPAVGTTTLSVNRTIAALAYNAASYCRTGTPTAVPAVTPAGGTFSSTPGLVVNAGTGVIDVAASAPGTYVVTYVSGGMCPATATATVSVTETVATLAYGASSFCRGGSTGAPAFSPAGGTFNSLPGLALNAGTGIIDLAASTPGTYIVTYQSSGACPGTATARLTVTQPVATLAYADSVFCRGGTTGAPAFSPAGGTFSSTPGLALNAGSGSIDLAASTPGAYTVTYVSGGTCSATTTARLLVRQQVATLAYAAGGATPVFCQAGTAPVVAATPAGGRFSSTAGLALDAGTGTVNLAASTPGTYTVNYAVAAPCLATTTALVTVAPPAPAFSYACPPFYQNGPKAQPVLTPVTGGTFSASAGLAVNPTTGVVDLASATVGTYAVTYTTPAGCRSTTPFQVVGKLVFPNVITPNGDNVNDVLRPNLANVTGYHLQVFSRWGIRVYEGRDPAQGWTAADNSGGLYYYQLEYTDCVGAAQNVRSWVEVIK